MNEKRRNKNYHLLKTNHQLLYLFSIRIHLRVSTKNGFTFLLTEKSSFKIKSEDVRV